jgi:ribonucleotide monophosphatase NagD (HAD superfamily)
VIFEVAISRLGIRSGPIWFVGDTIEEDMLGAARSGLRPILFAAGAIQPSPDLGCLHVRNWQGFITAYEAVRSS